MTHNRISEEMLETGNQATPPGFMLVAVAPNESAPMSPQQWLYQQMYERAQRDNAQPTTARELFAIMN